MLIDLKEILLTSEEFKDEIPSLEDYEAKKKELLPMHDQEREEDRNPSQVLSQYCQSVMLHRVRQFQAQVDRVYGYTPEETPLAPPPQSAVN